MTRQKRNSSALTIAQERAAGMQLIDENLDFGGDLNVSTYQAKIEATQAKLAEYNNLLGTLDKLGIELTQAESDLKDYSGKMLACVGARYGKTSWEYGEAGGTNSPKRTKTESPADTMLPADASVTALPIAELPKRNSRAAVPSLN